MKRLVDVGGKKRYVTEGPHLYVSQLLYKMGPMSSKKIWVEYLKDNAVDNLDFIHSKKYLKEKILYNMLVQGKIQKAQAMDIKKQNSRWGWQVVPTRAFKKTDPAILAKMKPLVPLDRVDYKEYLEKHDIKHDFWQNL